MCDFVLDLIHSHPGLRAPVGRRLDAPGRPWWKQKPLGGLSTGVMWSDLPFTRLALSAFLKVYFKGPGMVVGRSVGRN